VILLAELQISVFGIDVPFLLFRSDGNRFEPPDKRFYLSVAESSSASDSTRMTSPNNSPSALEIPKIIMAEVISELPMVNILIALFSQRGNGEEKYYQSCCKGIYRFSPDETLSQRMLAYRWDEPVERVSDAVR